MQRASRIGYEVAVDDTKLTFRKRANGESAVFALSQLDGLLEFRARLSSASQVTDVFVRGWSVQDKKAVLGHASASVPPRWADSRPAPTPCRPRSAPSSG